MRYPLARPLLVDLYQLTMMQAYMEHDMQQTAVFEFFVRRLPRQRNFLMAAGLRPALDFLQQIHFDDEDLAWLLADGRFSRDFVDYLEGFRFTGDVHAMPEGTIFFGDEPILRITAPLPMAQLVESRLINLLHFQSLIASKAARMVLAAPEKQLVDFGFRRTHGAEAGLLAARAAYLAGFAGTSTVEAAPAFGIPTFGTMAHSFIQAHDDEDAAFRHFCATFPDRSTLLIDTYDTEAAARKLVALAPELRRRGTPPGAVRLDSGDLAAQARQVRKIFDAGGLHDVRILVSGNLDEQKLASLQASGAPIDGYGIGTRMDTSCDAPYLDCAYKLQEYAGRARRKRSEGKATWPGRKQVYRRYDEQGQLQGDTLTTVGDTQPGTPLVHRFMHDGEVVEPLPSLHESRAHAVRELATLPDSLRRLEPADHPCEAEVTEAMQQLARDVDTRIGSQT